MTLEEVESYFGTLYAACKAIDITPQNITKWRKQGYVPYLQQYRIAMVTEGKLMPDDSDPCSNSKYSLRIARRNKA